MLALVAAAIHCTLSQYTTGKKVTVMFSQDEYQGKFCPSMVIDCITAEVTAQLINYPWWASSYPTSLMDLLHYDTRSSIGIGASIFHYAILNPLSDLDLERHYCIPHTKHPSPPTPPLPIPKGAPTLE
jgi:predicted oxidoreductase (fatty acid repression mutant protein)